MASLLTHRWSWSDSTVTTATAVAAAAAAAAVVVVTGTALWPRRRLRRDRPLRNPLLTTMPGMSEEERRQLVYQPDQFPGARDVDTPYGSVRVYEFGPEDGQKVLFIHGISTSCVTLGRLAHGLADRGCRVMLFDLFGRGFSDGVGDLPHDPRLYVSQVLLALSSSPLSWTGSAARLRVVGYSLGAGVAVHVANTIPHTVNELVLLAPAGLIRAETFGVVTRFVFSSGLVPQPILSALAKRRLRRPIASSSSWKPPPAATVTVAAVAAAEAADPPPGEPATPLESRVLAYVRWMAENHEGFVPAFLSSLRFAPLTDQHDAFAKLAARRPGSTAVILAESDEIIHLAHFSQDAPPLVGGRDGVYWRVLPGGHDFVMTHSHEILAELDEFWDSGAA